MTDLPYSAAAERNQQSILDVLRRLLRPQGTALEISAGTGQHAVWFAVGLPGWRWQPTEADASMLPAIAARAAQAGVTNVLPPMPLDVLAPWPAFAQRFDAVYCANMIHIAPWGTCAALMRGSARVLAPGGVLVTYGPYLEDGVTTSPGNLAFDASLRERNPTWGLRRMEDVCAQAHYAGLKLQARHAMPANNLLLVFGRSPTATA